LLEERECLARTVSLDFISLLMIVIEHTGVRLSIKLGS
jgi:hypothetical protein